MLDRLQNPAFCGAACCLPSLSPLSRPSWWTAGAATFNRANLQEAKKLCTDGATTGNLTANCGSVELETGILNPGAASASIGSSAAPSAALAIQERLRTARKSEGGGASSDEVVSLGQGLSVFASSGAEAHISIITTKTATSRPSRPLPSAPITRSPLGWSREARSTTSTSTANTTTAADSTPTPSAPSRIFRSCRSTTLSPT